MGEEVCRVTFDNVAIGCWYNEKRKEWGDGGWYQMTPTTQAKWHAKAAGGNGSCVWAGQEGVWHGWHGNDNWAQVWMSTLRKCIQGVDRNNRRSEPGSMSWANHTPCPKRTHPSLLTASNTGGKSRAHHSKKQIDDHTSSWTFQHPKIAAPSCFSRMYSKPNQKHSTQTTRLLTAN